MNKTRQDPLTETEQLVLKTRLQQAHGIPEEALARVPPGAQTAAQIADSLRDWLRGRSRQSQTRS